MYLACIISVDSVSYVQAMTQTQTYKNCRFLYMLMLLISASMLPKRHQAQVLTWCFETDATHSLKKAFAASWLRTRRIAFENMPVSIWIRVGFQTLYF